MCKFLLYKLTFANQLALSNLKVIVIVSFVFPSLDCLNIFALTSLPALCFNDYFDLLFRLELIVYLYKVNGVSHNVLRFL